MFLLWIPPRHLVIALSFLRLIKSIISLRAGEMNAKKEELVVMPAGGRELADASFYRLNDVPPELEWFANIANAHTRRSLPE